MTAVAVGTTAAGAALVYAWEPAIPPIATPSAASFSAEAIRTGEQLALVGDCRTCHTAPGGRVYAGGLAMPTPFGTIYSTNITPDPETGIGTWSQAAFKRAMRAGINRQGQHLYPAFPYDHFALTTDADISALYAFFMTRQPVKATAPANDLPFPINIRLVLAGWKLLFLHPKEVLPDPAHDAVWNRGRYLVEGLGHCGGCHSPRNLMGAEETAHGFGDLVRDELLQVDAAPLAPLTATVDFQVMNRPVRRIDLPAKVTGGAAYVQDMRLPGMLHARMIRPPSYGARLVRVDSAAVAAMPGVVKVVRDGNVLAVVAEDEWTAIKAMRTLGLAAEWAETPSLPDEDRLADALVALPAQDTVILDAGAPGAAGAVISGRFSRPYLSHGSIGPSCAIAELKDGTLTVWTHTQGVFPLRQAIAGMLKVPLDTVRCIHVEGAGCYGHNGADDVGADAALLAVAVPGRPIRVQWMREQEHAWDPFGPGMVTSVRAAVDSSGGIVDWHHEVWSQSHMMRPGPPGTLLAARDKSDPAPPAPPVALPQPEGGGDRNAIPLYAFPNARVVHHFLPEFPLRGSSMRSLGGYLNVVAIESTMDDLARVSGSDPVAFRLRHLQDVRGRAVIEAAAARFGWAQRQRLPPGGGYGFAIARYKNLEAYCAIAVEIAIEPETGEVAIRRVVAAVDTGEVINPDGVRNQIEGGIIQSASWTLFERVTFDRTRITSLDWSAYPILRFASVPGAIEVEILDQPGAPFLGVAEAAQGPAGAALANAIRDATGIRLRDLPLTAERIKSAIAR